MGLSRLFGLCVALLFASSVSAAVTIDLGPTDYRKFGPNPAHTPSGIRSSVPQTVRLPPSGTSLPVTRNSLIPYGSVANGAKTFLRVNPSTAAASAAVTALFLAVDWFFDDESGSWMKRGIETAPVIPGSDYWTDPYGNGQYPAPIDACRALFPYVNVVDLAPDGLSARCLFNGTVGTVRRTGDSCPDSFSFNTLTGVCEKSAFIDLDESDWSELAGYLPSAAPNLVGDAAHDIQRRIGGPLPGYHDTQISGPSSVTGPAQTTTSTDPLTGSTTTTQTTTQTNITYGDTTITTTNITVTNTYVDGQHTGTETTTDTPGELPVTEPVAAEWPGFCEWASIVCEWIDWTREEPDAEPDLPEVMDDDFYEQKSIQFGSKTCPPDYEINIAFLDTTVGVSMQPLCDFAGIIYYMVMAAAYIIAAYISIGVARNG